MKTRKQESKKSKLIVICGATGSGKTSLAVFLCKKFGGEIVSADSRQVYKYMDIGTGKELDSLLTSKKFGVATPRTILGIPIHLVDIVGPDERFTVGDFKALAEEKIADIISRGRTPFLVGGTGLYIDAVTENFSFLSSAKCKVQSEKQNQKAQNLEDAVGELLRVDPDAVTKIDLKNPRRVQRALEVFYETGIPFTQQQTKGERKYEVLKIAPAVVETKHALPLREKISKRVDQMIVDGLEKEALGLAKKYGWDSEAMTSIGYREWRSRIHAEFHADSRGTNRKIQNKKSQTINNGFDKLTTSEQSTISRKYDELECVSLRTSVIEAIKQHSLQYAKRQMTWFKRDKEIHWVENDKEAAELAESFLAQ